MLSMWSLWASRLLVADETADIVAKDGRKVLIKSWSHPAVPVYRFMFCAILVEWAWGCSIYVWNRNRVNYHFIMELRASSTSGRYHYQTVFENAINGTIVLLFNFMLFVKIVQGELPFHRYLPGGLVPVLALPYLFVHFFLPWKNSSHTLIPAIVATIGAPFLDVSFFASFVGDWLVSLVRVGADMLYTGCYVGTGAFLIDAKHVKSQRETVDACVASEVYVRVALPLVLALPLFFRMMQNYRRYTDTRQRWPHMYNAFKYALSLMVVVFAVFHPDSIALRSFYDRAWVAAYLVSTLYSFWWDLRMDWGLLDEPGRDGENMFPLRDRLMYNSRYYYYVAIVLDFFGRFVWTLTLIPVMRLGPFGTDQFVMSFRNYFGVIEILRRTMWAFFRCENEHLNNTFGYRRIKMVPMHFDSSRKLPDRPPTKGIFVIVELALLFVVVVGLSYASFTTRGV